VLQELQASDSSCLPLVLIDGVVVVRADYPTRERLLELLGMDGDQA
jgi:hypothetical protein